MSEAFAHALASSIEVVSRHLWGDPEPGLSGRGELRWGQHGSRSVDLDKGVWHDHEAGAGGGVMDMVLRETGLKGREAVDYLRDNVGIEIPDDSPAPVRDKAPKKVVATYDYRDLSGNLVFQVVRLEPKDFRQRRPDPAASDGWSWSVKGVKQVPYRLDELFGLEGKGFAYICEGEKDADRLIAMGIPATCNAGGAGKWPADLNPYFDGLDVVVLPDNDSAGEKHADVVAGAVREYAKSVRVLRLPGLDTKGDVSDWLDAGGSPEQLEELTRVTKVWTPHPPQSRFGAIQWSDIDSVGIRQDWLIEDMMFEGDAGLIFGASGSGKSFLAVDMGLSIARGVPFLGKATRAGAVLYQAGEGGKGLVKRLRAYRQDRIVQGDVPFILLPARVDLFGSDGDGDAFIEECRAWKVLYPDLAALFIDTLSTASPGANENASEDMSRLLKWSERIQREIGCAVIWVHHKNAAGDRERGHTSLRANVDTAIEINRSEDDERTLKVVKIKDGEDGEKIGFELQSVTIGTYDSGKPMTSCVVRPAEVGSARTGKTQRLPNGPHLFLTCLDDAVGQKGGIIPPNCGPSNAYGVQWEDFRDLYRAVRAHNMDDNAMRQAIKREGDSLIAKGLIQRFDRWLWITQTGGEYLTVHRK